MQFPLLLNGRRDGQHVHCSRGKLARESLRLKRSENKARRVPPLGRHFESCNAFRGAFGPLLAEIDWLHAVVVEVTLKLASAR